MRRVFGDGVISAAALLLLVIVLVSVDDRVRERVGGLVGGSATPSSSQLRGAGQQVSSFAGVLFDAVKDQSVAHAPLVIFSVASAVLVIFMVRT